MGKKGLKFLTALIAIIGIIVLLIASCGRGKSAGISGKSSASTDGRHVIGAEPDVVRELALSAIIEEIRQFEIPQGTDKSVFERLREELIKELENRGDVRIPSAAPKGESNNIDDLSFDSETHLLTWTYRNAGDYNLDGVVGIADVTKIAQLYLIRADESENPEYVEWVDGSGDGIIGISDITPIALSYLAEVAGYSIIGADPSGDELVWEEIEYIPVEFERLVNAYPEEGEFPLVISADFSKYAGWLLKVAPVDSEGVAGTETDIIIAEALPLIKGISPAAAVEYSNTTFEAEVYGSPPLDYAWDFGGAAAVETSSEPSPEVRLNATGSYMVKLTVTNDLGSAEYEYELQVTDGTGAPVILNPPDKTVKPHQVVTFEAEAVGTSPLTYSWDFGGGATPDTAVGEMPEVTTTAPGEYTGTLTVSNSKGQDAVSFAVSVETIPSNMPQPILTIQPAFGNLPLLVRFDASYSYGNSELMLFEWFVDDKPKTVIETGSTRTIEFLYEADTAKEGPVAPYVRVTDSEGRISTASLSLYLNGNPKARISASPKYAQTNWEITFSATGSYDSTGSIVRYEWDLDGDGEFELDTGSENFTSSTFATEGDYQVGVRVTDEYGLSDDAYATVYVRDNHLPIVYAYTTTDRGNVPFEATFIIESATDLDGSISYFEMDYDGDGTFDEISPIMRDFTHTYTEPDIYSPVLRVTDNDGGYTEVVFEVTAVDEWTIFTLDDGGHVGEFPSLEVFYGYPAISYRDVTNGNLKFVRAADTYGESWNAPQTIVASGAVREKSAIVIADFNPAVAYSSNGLRFIRASDSLGNTWNPPVLVDSYNNIFKGISATYVYGRPAVSYYETSRQYVRYVRAANASGSSWDAPVVVYSYAIWGNSSSLALVNGNPAIAFSSYNPASVQFIRALDSYGASWPSSGKVIFGQPDDGSYHGRNPCLAVIGGVPMISFRTGIAGPLGKYCAQFSAAIDANGETWPLGSKLDGGYPSGDFYDITSIANIGGKPAIAYCDPKFEDLRYIEALDSTGTEWGKPIVVDSEGNVGYHTSMISFWNQPAIAYYDKTNGSLKFAMKR